MKPDSERTKRYFAKRHQAVAYLHAHLSKDLRKKMKVKRRALLVHKGDKVKVMRGFAKGKTAKITTVDYNKSAVYLEGINHNSARGKEAPMAMQPSNLMLVELESTSERRALLGEGAVFAPVQSTAPPASHTTPAPHATHTEHPVKHTETHDHKKPEEKHEAKHETHHEKSEEKHHEKHGEDKHKVKKEGKSD